jgi:hypothetical protein
MKLRLPEMTLETLIQREIARRVWSVFNPMAPNGTLAQAIDYRLALQQLLAPWR